MLRLFILFSFSFFISFRVFAISCTENASQFCNYGSDSCVVSADLGSSPLSFCPTGFNEWCHPGSCSQPFNPADPYNPVDPPALPKPVDPKSLPNLPSAVAAALAAAGLLLAGASAVAGAPVLVTGGALAAAAHAAVAAVASWQSPSDPKDVTPPTIQDAASSSPIAVTLQPLDDPAPPPSPSGTGNAPSVAVNPDGSFAPVGDQASSPSGEGWSKSNDGAWSYKGPDFSAQISSDGLQLTTVQDSPNSPIISTIGKHADGYFYSTSANAPVYTDSGGQSSTQFHTVQNYTNQGNASGPSSSYVGSVTSSGESTGNGAGVRPVMPGVTPPATGQGTSVNDGQCVSMGSGCSTEKTQLDNKRLLQGIEGFLRDGQATFPELDKSTKTATDFESIGYSFSNPAFSGLLAWRIPAHTSTCPNPSFMFNGRTYSFDYHCQLVIDHFGAFRSVFIASFTFMGLLIVLKA